MDGHGFLVLIGLAVGFALLMLLLLVVTYRDLLRLQQG